jgi:hypothetical protein
VTVAIPGHAGWLVDLTGSPVADFDGSFPLRPREMATAHLGVPASIGVSAVRPHKPSIGRRAKGDYWSIFVVDDM